MAVFLALKIVMNDGRESKSEIEEAEVQTAA